LNIPSDVFVRKLSVSVPYKLYAPIPRLLLKDPQLPTQLEQSYLVSGPLVSGQLEHFSALRILTNKA